MDIIIKPDEIIKRCLWSRYRKFVLDKTDENIEEVITKNEPFLLSENDAYVIGLLKIIETDRLTHRFNIDMDDFLKIKSFINVDRVVINKSSILKEIIEFKDRFPVDYKPDIVYEKSISELKEWINYIYKRIDELETIPAILKDGKTYTCVLSNDVKRILTKKDVKK